MKAISPRPTSLRPSARIYTTDRSCSTSIEVVCCEWETSGSSMTWLAVQVLAVTSKMTAAEWLAEIGEEG
jgi:hypothetical protein